MFPSQLLNVHCFELWTGWVLMAIKTFSMQHLQLLYQREATPRCFSPLRSRLRFTQDTDTSCPAVAFTAGHDVSASLLLWLTLGCNLLSLVMIWYSRSYRGQMEAIKLNFWAEAVLSNFLKLPHTVRLKKSIYAGSRGPDPSWLRSRESHNLESPINPWENPHRESDAYLEIPEHFAV